jgi:type I restriction enzyme M protein
MTVPTISLTQLESHLWEAANILRRPVDAADFKTYVFPLLFFKRLSDVHDEEYQTALEESGGDEAYARFSQHYRFQVPEGCHWRDIRAVTTNVGQALQTALREVEKANPETLYGIFSDAQWTNKDRLSDALLRDLIEHFSRIALGNQVAQADILGQSYEYLIKKFADATNKKAGEFYTPRSVVRVLVEMLEPYSGRVYDPCCGSGGMFVQSEKFVQEHGGRIGDIAIYGQESNYTTWRLAKMNLAVRGIDSDIRWNNEGSFHKDELRDLKADYILANPPFNISDWGGDRLREDVRWKFGAPPVGNANYAWLQHIYHHLAPNGTAGVVLANGSMSSNQSGEGDIRKAMLEADAVDCMVALPGQLFYSTQIPACLWFLARNKNPGKGLRDRRGHVLFIDARKMGVLVDRTRRELTDEEVQKIADTYHAWRGENKRSDVSVQANERAANVKLQSGGRSQKDAGEYADVPGFCKSASMDDIRKHGYVLTPGRYVGAAEQEDDGVPFEEKMLRLSAQWREQRTAATKLDAAIEANLKELGYGE